MFTFGGIGISESDNQYYNGGYYNRERLLFQKTVLSKIHSDPPPEVLGDEKMN
jgi:hypothetical protein